MPKSKVKIKKDDTVLVISGDDRGKKGKVLEVWPDDNKVVVERVNVVKKHQKATQKFQGGIIEKPMAFSLTNVMFVCPKCSEPTRLSRKQVGEKRLRACAKCSEIVDKE